MLSRVTIISWGLLGALSAPWTQAVAADFEKDVMHVFFEKARGSAVVLSDAISLHRSYGARAAHLPSVPAPTHTMWDVAYGADGPVFTYLYDDQALRAPEQIVLDLMVFSKVGRVLVTDFWNLTLPKEMRVQSIHEFAEMLVDAQHGSAGARARLAEIENAALQSVALSPLFLEDFPLQEAVSRLGQRKAQEFNDLKSKAFKDQRRREKAFAKWKAQGLWDRIEASPRKLNDLLVNNDRAGVAKMIRSYLPWTLMEPVETEFWKIWLDAIEHPDLKNQTVALRGVSYDTDKVQRKQTPKGEALGFFSTLLTKNQGSYTRRLRSLATKRLQTGNSAYFSKSVNPIPNVRVTSQMRTHSAFAEASSFLSFTSNPETALDFIGSGAAGDSAKGGILVVRMDSRRLVPNLTSPVDEYELLAPLVIFPDEVIAYTEKEFKTPKAYQAFLDEVSEKQGLPPMSADEVRPGSSIEFARGGYGFFKNLLGTPGAAGGLCSRVWN